MVALPAAIIGLPPVQEKLFDRAPKISLELASEIAVLDIRNPMRGLTISLYGQDLNASKEALVASRVVIRNTGKIGIKSSDMSASDPLGFAVKGGELLQITRFAAATSHLRKYANPKRMGNRVLLSDDIIIDNGDSLQFDLLIKKQRNSNIDYFPLGKISNIKSIKILDLRNTGAKRGFIEETFYGNLFVQLSRIAAYFIAGLIILAGILFTYESINTFFEKRKLEKIKAIVDRFIESSSNRNKTADALAAAIFGVGGLYFLESVLSKVEKIPVSSTMGKISSARMKIIGENIAPNFDSILEFFDRRVHRIQRWLPRVEEKFNLVNSDRTTVQQAYINSLRSMADIAKAMDPHSKLSSKSSRYYELDDLEYREAGILGAPEFRNYEDTILNSPR